MNALADVRRPPAEDVKEESTGDERLWSVTTIISCLDKPAIPYWAAEETAKAAVSVAGSLTQRIAEDGEEQIIKWLRDARWRRPKGRLSSANLGSVVHAACEDYALSGKRPDDDQIAGYLRAEGGARFDGIAAETPVVNLMLDRFDEWLARFQPSYQAAEVTVYHPTYGYAGTCDGFLTIDNTPLIFDYKTSRDAHDSRGNPKTPYPEAALQIAAYRYAEFAAVWRPRRIEKLRRRYYLLSNTERNEGQPLPQVDGGIVIHITPEHCEAFPVQCDQPVFDAFLYVLEASRWVNGLAKTVINPPLVEMD